MASLSLRGITKRYASGAAVLSGVDLEVSDGELLVLVGPSGCGKSTLLRIVAGLVAADEGTVALDGRPVDDLEPRERDVAMVFQNYALYPHMTVRANLGFPLRMAGLPRGEVAARVAEAAELLGLGPLLGRRPGQLSGGQMQRVAVGRAIVRRPRVFLFDEPLSNLDAQLREAMRAELRRLHERLGTTTLYVTHDQAEAMTLGDRICVLDGGAALQVGPPLEVFERPATSFVAGFIGSPAANLIEGRASGGRFRAGPLERACPAEVAGPLVLGIRPQHVRAHLAADGPWVVEEAEALGTEVHLVLRGEDVRLAVRRAGSRPPRTGERLRVELPDEHAHWFEAGSGRRLD